MKAKRSRAGCISCKKLKIKCDEGKPSCEYCRHTRRECVYLGAKTTPDVASVSKVVATRKDSLDVLTSSLAGMMNSLSSQLQISNFEHRLLKFFIEFGGSFFAFEKNNAVNHFWTNEAPKLCLSSKLVKSSVFTISSVFLWKKFAASNMMDVLLPNTDEENETTLVNLYNKSSEFFNETLKLSRETLEPGNIRNQKTAVTSLIGHIIIYTFVTVHPISPTPLIRFNDSQEYFVDALDVSKSLTDCAIQSYPLLINTKYKCLIFHPDAFTFPDDDNEKLKFPIVEDLKTYLTQISKYGMNQDTVSIYNQAINALEVGVYRAFKFDYQPHLFIVVLYFAKDCQPFIELVRNKDPFAMKIMYYYCSICSICGFKLFNKYSIWDQYVELYKKYCCDLFDGTLLDKFEDYLYGLTLDSQGAFYKDMEMKDLINLQPGGYTAKYKENSPGLSS